MADPAPAFDARRAGLELASGQRVGVFGGSFNPAHEGHLHVARIAMERLRLDRLVWLVSPQNPLKPVAETMTLKARMEGVRRLAGAGMIVSDFETRLGLTYTVDTLETLKGYFPGVRFVWVMGSDNLMGFHRWRGWRQIARMMPIAVVARPGSARAHRISTFARRFDGARIPERQARRLATMRPPAWVFLRDDLNDASSTAIRSRLLARDHLGS